MSDTLSPLLQALDRLDRLPAAPRCAGPDWSTHTQARDLQALYAEHHGHHVPADWAEKMWPLLQTETSASLPQRSTSGPRLPCYAQYSWRQWGMFLAGMALATYLAMGSVSPRAHAPLNQEDSRPVTPSDLVPFTADIPGAPSMPPVSFVD